MRTPRIYTPQSLHTEQSIALEADASHHVHRVLRLKIGDTLLLFNGDGYEYKSVIQAIDQGKVLIATMQRLHPQRESNLLIELGQGISRAERMDFTLQKSVELGVSQITPLWTARTEVRLSGMRLDKRLAHWEGVVRSAAEQSGRLRLPGVNPSCQLEDWCARTDTDSLNVILDPQATRTLADLKPGTTSIRLLIGAEGGLDDRELACAESQGFTGIHLGPRTLRTETAAVAALASLQTLWGDLR